LGLVEATLIGGLTAAGGDREQVTADQPVTGTRLAEAAGVSASYGRALLAEFQANPTLTVGQANGQRPTVEVGER
jgi:hypothetical protein